VACFGNGAEAARQVGIEPDNARQQAWDWLQREDVRERVDVLAAERLRTLSIEADEVLREMHRIAMADIALAFDPLTNDLLAVHDMPEVIRRGVSGVKIETRFEGTGRDRREVGFTKEVKFWNKERCLEMLARTLALFKDSLTVKSKEAHEVDENSRAARVASLFEVARQRRDSGADLV
jgi:phage terminase small subunit